MRQALMLLVALTCAPTLTAQTAQVMLALEPSATLPGIPVTFRFTVENPTSRTVRVPRWSVLHVAPVGGDPFISRWMGEWVANISDYTEQESLPPHQSLSFAIPLDYLLASPAWFSDSRLCQPGTYNLRILLNDKLTQDGVRGKTAARVLSEYGTTAFLSNDVTLTVRDPIGADAEVWSYLNKQAGGEFSAAFWPRGHELAKRIWTEYAGSTYARYVAALVPARETAGRMSILNQALAADPGGPLAEWYRLRLASLQRRKYGEAIGLMTSGETKDGTAAKAEADLAIKALSALASGAKEPLIRKLAAQELADLKEDIELDLGGS